MTVWFTFIIHKWFWFHRWFYRIHFAIYYSLHTIPSGETQRCPTARADTSRIEATSICCPIFSRASPRSLAHSPASSVDESSAVLLRATSGLRTFADRASRRAPGVATRVRGTEGRRPAAAEIVQRLRGGRTSASSRNSFFLNLFLYRFIHWSTTVLVTGWSKELILFKECRG